MSYLVRAVSISRVAAYLGVVWFLFVCVFFPLAVSPADVGVLLASLFLWILGVDRKIDRFLVGRARSGSRAPEE